MKKIKLALLSLTFFALNTKAEAPQKWCEVRGFYQRTVISIGDNGENGTLEICALISTAHCYYIPCTNESNWDFETFSTRIPQGIEIDLDKPFWARREDGVLKINYLQTLNVEHEVENGIDIVTIIH